MKTKYRHARQVFERAYTLPVKKQEVITVGPGNFRSRFATETSAGVPIAVSRSISREDINQREIGTHNTFCSGWLKESPAKRDRTA